MTQITLTGAGRFLDEERRPGAKTRTVRIKAPHRLR